MYKYAAQNEHPIKKFTYPQGHSKAMRALTDPWSEDPGTPKSGPRGPEAKTNDKRKGKKEKKRERTVAKLVPSAPLVLSKRNEMLIWK